MHFTKPAMNVDLFTEHLAFWSGPMGLAAEPPRRIGDVAVIALIRDPDGNFIERSQKASLVGALVDSSRHIPTGKGIAMKPSPETMQEETALVCLACGQLAEIPARQMRDFYRGQRLVAIACACALILYAALSLV